MMVTGICNGCGKKIVWLLLDDGTKVPLDPTPAVYFIEGQTGGSIESNATYRGRRANGHKDRAVGQAMVSHFSTCPKATDFSGRNKV